MMRMHNAVMRTLTIRNVPEDVYRSLKATAVRNHRSIQQQVLVLLETLRRLDTESPLTEAASMRARLAGRDLGDSVAEIRAERER